MSDTQNNFQIVTPDLAHCSRHQQTFRIGLGCIKCKEDIKRDAPNKCAIANCKNPSGENLAYCDGHWVQLFHERNARTGITAPHDPVNHPKHYNSHPSGVECITITRHMGFNIGNAIKYLWRADEKGNALQDLEKAAWYIADEIKRRKQNA